MMRIFATMVLLTICLLAACGGRNNSQEGISGLSTLQAVPQISPGSPEAQIFNAALPEDGHFRPNRAAAVSSFTRLGAEFNSASANVAVDGSSAGYSPGASAEFAIWRFDATPADSLGSLDISLADVSSGASYWVGIANYDSGRWQWLGSSGDPSLYHYDLNDSPGEHSSPAGHIYIAVLSATDLSFKVSSLTIEYLQRFNVSGVVMDLQDKLLPGVLLTTNLSDPQQVLSGADGTFTLNGIPNGDWAVMANLSGYQFLPAASMVTVDNADVINIILRGNPQNSGFPDDGYEPNNWIANSGELAELPLADATISILDDPVDCYRFPVATQGWHYLQFRGDESILFPGLKLYTEQRIAALDSDEVLYGANWLCYYFQRPGNYYVELSCQGGGGHYGLSLLDGQCATLSCFLVDTGDPDDGGDGLYEEMRYSRVEMQFPDYTMSLSQYDNGEAYHGSVPPLPATIVPISERYTFTPASRAHDFSTGDLDPFDFNLSAAAPSDPMEPNNDKATATPLTLPGTVQGFIGGFDLTGNDDDDYFSFNVAEGKHVRIRVKFPELSSKDFNFSGTLYMFDAADNQLLTYDLSGLGVLDIRSNDPLSAGSYYIILSLAGEVTPFELEAIQYDARHLNASFVMDGNGLDFGKMLVQPADLVFHHELEWSGGSTFYSVPFLDNERLQLSYQRYGMSFDPPGEWVEFKGGDVSVAPVLSLTTDNYEPSNKFSEPYILSYPVDIEASLSIENDYWDYYELTGLAGTPIQISLQPADPDSKIKCELFTSGVNVVLQEYTAVGDETFYFVPPAPGNYTIALTAMNNETTYHLTINDSPPVYRISGSLDSGNPGESYSGTFVSNLTTGHEVAVKIDSYDLGYHLSGSYDIRWFISDHTVTPAGVKTVVVSNADVVQDFSAVYNDHDNLEPNDSGGTAATVPIPFSGTASLDAHNQNLGFPDGDVRDFYKFVAPQNGEFEVKVTPWHLEPNIFKLSFFEEFDTNLVNIGKITPATGAQLCRYVLKAGTTYYIEVQGSRDLEYSIEGSYP